jgi:hypothetical protein
VTDPLPAFLVWLSLDLVAKFEVAPGKWQAYVGE